MSASVGIITDVLEQIETDSAIPIITSQAFGIGSVLVSFQPPANDGGTPITGYMVTSSPGGVTAMGATSPILVTGLTDGTTYTFTVTAMNIIGVGPPSAPSNPEAPSGVPSAPTALVATALNASASVAFTAPYDGGSAITGYVVTSSPGSFTGTGVASPIVVSGLANGVAYTFTAVAINVNGTGPASAPSNSVTPVASVPSAPQLVTAAAGNAQAAVSFSPPASTGGSPITGYTAVSSPGGFSRTGGSSPLTVLGLTNGTAYTFTVFASNVAGNGPPSAPSNSVTPAGVPGSPTVLSVVGGNASAVVTFSAPSSTGGSPITGYTATATAGGIQSAFGAGSPLTIMGLTNGTTYEVTVTASNAAGTGLPSSPPVAVTPAAVPSAPTAVVGTPGNAQVSVAFTAPSSTGGSPITGYTVTTSPGGGTTSGGSSPILVTGLTNGTAYTFTVTATNAAGNSPASTPSSAVTPYTIPGAATALTAIGENASALISFTAAPANGSPVTNYTLTSSPGGFTGSGAASPVTVTGLANGTAYTFTAVATNAAGAGPTSAASNSVTPAAVPGAPTGVSGVAGNAQVVVSFTAPSSTGGSPITGYTVTASPGGAHASGASSPITVTGLANGTAYTFTAVATNSAGSGPASAPSSAVMPFTIPGAATSLVATRGNAQASIAFTAAPNNGSPITNYTLTSSPGGFTGSGATSPVVVTGLTNGTAYTFTAVATNSAGAGPASAASNSVTPATVPGAPTAVAGTAGNAQVSVTFTAPGSNGGSAITSYTATSSPGGFTGSGASSPVAVSGLANGTAYTFTVTATNAVGTGAASSASSSVTPFTVPGVPTSLSATPGNAQATITFSAPSSNGGSVITGYTVTSNPGGFTASGGSSPLTVTGLTNGTSYDFTAVATNAAGNSSPSAPSNFVTPSSTMSSLAFSTPRLLPNTPFSSTSFPIALTGGSGSGYVVTILGYSSSLKSAGPDAAPTPGNTWAMSGNNLACTSPSSAETDYFLLQGKDSASNTVTGYFQTTASSGANPLVITNTLTAGYYAAGTVFTSGAPLCSVLAVGNVAAVTYGISAQTGINTYSINSSTGAITGTGTNVGTDSITVTATDGTHTATPVTIAVTIQTAVATASRPAGNTAFSFFTKGTELFDANGNLFRIRGVDQDHFDETGTPQYAGINAVRYVLDSGHTDSSEETSYNTQHVANHRFGTIARFGNIYVSAYQRAQNPGSGGSSNGQGWIYNSSGDNFPSLVTCMVQDWINYYSVWSPLMNKIAINIANEWGGFGIASNTYLGTYQGVTNAISSITSNVITFAVGGATNPYANCKMGYIVGTSGVTNQMVDVTATGGSSGAWTVTIASGASAGATSPVGSGPGSGPTSLTGTGGTFYGGAVAALRAAGYTCPIVIDADGFGQSPTNITAHAAAILASDPFGCIIFDMHAYGNLASSQSALNTALANAAATGCCFAILEFGYPGDADSSVLTAYQTIQSCENHGIGWCGWAMDDNNGSGGASNDSDWAMIYQPSGNSGLPANYTAVTGKPVILDVRNGCIAMGKLASSL